VTLSVSRREAAREEFLDLWDSSGNPGALGPHEVLRRAPTGQSGRPSGAQLSIWPLVVR
jgi:hypothetical protein